MRSVNRFLVSDARAHKIVFKINKNQNIRLFRAFLFLKMEERRKTLCCRTWCELKRTFHAMQCFVFEYRLLFRLIISYSRTLKCDIRIYDGEAGACMQAYDTHTEYTYTTTVSVVIHTTYRWPFAFIISASNRNFYPSNRKNCQSFICWWFH